MMFDRNLKNYISILILSIVSVQNLIFLGSFEKENYFHIFVEKETQPLRKCLNQTIVIAEVILADAKSSKGGSEFTREMTMV